MTFVPAGVSKRELDGAVGPFCYGGEEMLGLNAAARQRRRYRLWQTLVATNDLISLVRHPIEVEGGRWARGQKIDQVQTALFGSVAPELVSIRNVQKRPKLRLVPPRNVRVDPLVHTHAIKSLDVCRGRVHPPRRFAILRLKRRAHLTKIAIGVRGRIVRA